MNTNRSIGLTMGRVLVALLPALLVQAAAFGPMVVAHVLLGVAGALAAEALVLSAGRRPVVPALADRTAAVTGVLVGLAVTPLAPLWLTFTAAGLGVALGKHAYGGVGRNPFNPAMVGYALVLVSFPALIGAWPATGVDATTAATPLDLARHADLAIAQGLGVAGAGDDPWPWIGAAYALGGCWLLATRDADGWLVGGMLAGLVLAGAVLQLMADGNGALFHLLHGAALCGAFFIITDPVSAPAGRRARVAYAAFAGVLTVAIREFGGYPDGLAFAVLLANAMGPVFERTLAVDRR